MNKPRILVKPLPCPWCGARPALVSGAACVACDACGAVGAWDDDDVESVAKWNAVASLVSAARVWCERVALTGGDDHAERQAMLRAWRLKP